MAADSPYPPTPSPATKAYFPEAPTSEDFAAYKARKEVQIAELEIKLARITSDISDLRVRDASDKGSGKRRRQGSGGRGGGGGASGSATESPSGSEADGSQVGVEGYVSSTSALAEASAETRRQHAAAACGATGGTPSADTPTAASALATLAAGFGLAHAPRPPFTVPDVCSGGDDTFEDNDGDRAELDTSTDVVAGTSNNNNAATAAAAAELLAQLRSSRSDADRLATLERRLRAADAELAAARKRSRENALQR